jgi:DNA-binding CsgD family transcriptional regulator
MELWQRLLEVLSPLLRPRPAPGRRVFELDDPLEAALAARADQEHLPVEQVQADLLAAGLANLQTSDELKRIWERLSPREREVTALTCLGYTNRQMAARLCISTETVKTHVRMALIKWQVRTKEDLRLLLSGWDFNAWGPLPLG